MLAFKLHLNKGDGKFSKKRLFTNIYSISSYSLAENVIRQFYSSHVQSNKLGLLSNHEHNLLKCAFDDVQSACLGGMMSYCQNIAQIVPGYFFFKVLISFAIGYEFG